MSWWPSENAWRRPDDPEGHTNSAGAPERPSAGLFRVPLMGPGGRQANRADPVTVLEENNRPRLPDLVPVRYGRMLTSPFAFLRGSAVIDGKRPRRDAHHRACGCRPCGDAHLG